MSSSMTDKQKQFDLIKAARDSVRDVNFEASEKTRAQYRVAFRRMRVAGLLPLEMSKTARGFYFYRAAWIHEYATEIREVLRQADILARSGNEEEWRNTVERLAPAMSCLGKYPPDPHRKARDTGQLGDWAINVEKHNLKPKSHSKRAALRKLSPGWQDTVLAFTGKKYRNIVSLLALSGARPSEFETGICVKRLSAAELEVTINGTKTHGGKFGQLVRTLKIDPTRSECGRQLAASVDAAGGVIVVTGEARAITRRIGEFGRKAFPNKTHAISAYVFRHQVGADLKNSGLSDVDISTALGHSSDETKRYYGARQSARGGSITSASGTKVVRQHTREKIRILELSRGYSMHRGY